MTEISFEAKTQIYCESDLMHDIQMAAIYPDSKTFVDKKLKYTESEIMVKYEDFKRKLQDDESMHFLLMKFVDENFEDGDELEIWVPPDFTSHPSIVDRIVDSEYKQWALSLNEVWKTLARKIKEDVKIHPELYSLIWVPNGFCIPGGRFRELYYWDTYWIVNGLLLCDMKQTARGIIENIISMVNRFGFMPNGNRVYYLNRSQPPLLILMVFNYFQNTKDFNFIFENIDTLTTEFEFWMTNRMIYFEKDGKTYHMARYFAPSQGPRPESYREDYEIAHHFENSQEQDIFYTRIKSAAETGWDFSSRWFIKDGGSHGSLRDINAPGIIPVDLNAFMHANALALSTWWIRIGNEEKSQRYRDIANEFLRGLQEVLWREDIGTWFDWDLINKKHREYFYVSNITPLWTGSYTMPKKHAATKTIQYLVDNHIIENDYSIKYNGTPSSMQASKEQWDYPNAWPPLQAFLIQGLDRTNQRTAQIIAFHLAQVWLSTNHKGFTNYQMMFEKYNSLQAGETGTGGEYLPQTGFGWTNGVILEFLDRWGRQLRRNSTDLNRTPLRKKWSYTVTEDNINGFYCT
ncbi:hypothetical protein PGB90_010558 [Kerria lacca]